MNPLRLQAANYRAFESLDLELPSGCIAIIGENGAGKSSIVNLIDICLFGTRSLGEYLSASADDAELEMTLDFEHAGNLYRVRRSFSGRGRGKTTLDFERSEEHMVMAPAVRDGEPDEYPALGWMPLTREDQKQTQALIEETLGLSRETFRASAFLAQGDGAAFTEAQPRDRKRILCEVLGLDVWDRLAASARSEVVTIRDTTSRLSIQIEEADRELAAKDDVAARQGQIERDLVQAQDDLDEAEAAHEKAQGNLSTFRETTAKLVAAREVLASRKRELDAGEKRNREIMVASTQVESLSTQKAEAAKLAGQERDLEQELTEALAVDEARKEHQRLMLERARMLGEASELNEKAHALRVEADMLDARPLDDGATCPTCEQVLGFDGREATLKNLREQADLLDATATGKDQVAGEVPVEASAVRLEALNSSREADLIQADLRRARAAREEVASITERLSQIAALQAERDELLGQLSGMSQAVTDSERDVATLEADLPAEDLEAVVSRAAGTLIEARNVHSGLNGKLVVAKAELDRLAGVEARTAENRRAMAEHKRELDLLQLEERVYGRDGIPVFILESTAIPALEVEAQRILGLLGGKTAAGRIELRTQRALKSGDGLKESLDIVLYTAEGGEQAYEHWSGGEKMRINLALRLALANVLANRRGAESQVFVLDEPGDLDLAGKQALVELLREVHSRGIDKVLLVSHDSDLRDAFDESIEVEIGDDGRSRIAGSVAEAVTA